MYQTSETLLNAVTATTTSAGYYVGDRLKMSIQVFATGISAGNGVFTVDVSNDGTNWTAYNRLTSNVTNTNAQNDTRVASVTLSSNTSNFLFFPEGDHFRYIRITVTRTTDGTYSAILNSTS